MELWQREEQICFEDCVFADEHVAEDVRDFLSPACTDNLLLWGPPGTGKSAVVRAVAYERFGTTELHEEGVDVLDCKNKRDAQRIDGKWLDGWYNFAHFNSDCPVLILDELDELTEGQQRELTAFVNRTNLGSLRSMILATTNVDLRDNKARAKHFSAALLSRFNVKLEMRMLHPLQLVPLVQKKLATAGLSFDDDTLLALLEKHLQVGSTTMDFRQVQTLVNRLIRRASEQKPSEDNKPRLKLV